MMAVVMLIVVSLATMREIWGAEEDAAYDTKQYDYDDHNDVL